MTQTSAPLVGAQFTDAAWRDLFGDEPGIVGDLDGTAYSVALAPDSDTAYVGSATQVSTARVAGFSHRIPTNEHEPVTIPAASGSPRTDIIALRYDPAYNDAPGPVRLVRIAGTSSGLPVYDSSPPGVEDLPLWGVTRAPGQGLAAATLIDLRARLAPSLEIPASAPLPLSSPFGTLVRRGTTEFRRELSGGVPVWVPFSGSPIVGVYDAPFTNPAGAFGNDPQEITNFTVPDPGRAYRPQISMEFEAGSTQTSTRWDFLAGYGGSGNGPLTTILASSRSVYDGQERLVRHHNVTGPIGPVLTGARTYRIVADRVLGGATGAITTPNRLFRVVYWAA